MIKVIALLIFVSLTLQNAKADMFVKKMERLEGLKPHFKKKIVELLEWADQEFPGAEMTVACGYRSPEEQDRLYAKGRHITNLKGGESKHQHRLAVDLFFLKDDKIEPYNDKYLSLGLKAEKLGLRWGGRWKQPFDPGHFEI